VSLLEFLSVFLVEDGIAEGLQNWLKVLTFLYVDLIEAKTKTDAPESISVELLSQTEQTLREQRLHTIYTVMFFIDSFFSIASAIVELQKFTRYLRVSDSKKQKANIVIDLNPENSPSRTKTIA
jgi:hypothetical protein